MKEKQILDFQEEKSKAKKIKNILEYVIIVSVILVNVILIFESVSNPNKTPSLFGKKAFVIVSGSMIPEIQIGDIVIVNETNKVKVQDVIAFRKDANVIVHRIVKEMQISGKTMYQTKGDNNNVADAELIEMKNIEGIVVSRIPFIGKILILLYNNIQIVIIFILLFLISRYFIKKYM